MNTALWAFFLSGSQTFLNAVPAKSMETLFHNACVFYVAKAHRAVEFRAQDLE